MEQPHRPLAFPNMVLVSGCGRNVGKTTLCCKIIEHLSGSVPVTGVKISSGFSGGNPFHGNHSVTDKIFRETDTRGNKDTMRFLRAGAGESWLLQAGDKELPEVFRSFLSKINPRTVLVCESNALAAFVKPAVHIYITDEQDKKTFYGKPDVVLKPLDFKGFVSLAGAVTVKKEQELPAYKIFLEK